MYTLIKIMTRVIFSQKKFVSRNFFCKKVYLKFFGNFRKRRKQFLVIVKMCVTVITASKV